MSQSYARQFAGAPVDATYLAKTSNSTLTAEQDLSALSTGYARVTTGTGVVSTQAVPLTIAQGGTTNTSLTANGILIGNGTSALTVTSAGASTTLLRGQTGGDPIFGQGVLTTDVTGVTPIANGGTNASTTWTAGSIMFSDGTRFVQDNANLFWDDTPNSLYVGGATSGTADIILNADGSAVFNEQGTANTFRVEGDTATNLFTTTGIGTTTASALMSVGSSRSLLRSPLRIEGQTVSNLFVATSGSKIGIRNSSPIAKIDIQGGLSLPVRTETGTTYAHNTLTDFCIMANPGVGGITITLSGTASEGHLVFIKKINSTAGGTVTITPATVGDLIDGAASVTLITQWSSRLLIRQGGDWYVIESI